MKFNMQYFHNSTCNPKPITQLQSAVHIYIHVRVRTKNAKIKKNALIQIRLLPACTFPLWCISPPRWWWGSPWWPWPRIPHPWQQRQLVIMGQRCPWIDSLSCHSSSSSLDCFSLFDPLFVISLLFSFASNQDNSSCWPGRRLFVLTCL